MQWIKSGIENPSKSEVIGRCGGDEKMTMHNRQKSNAKKKKRKIQLLSFNINLNININKGDQHPYCQPG